MIDKNLVLINYLNENANVLGIKNFHIKSEYSIDDADLITKYQNIEKNDKAKLSKFLKRIQIIMNIMN